MPEWRVQVQAGVAAGGGDGVKESSKRRRNAQAKASDCKDGVRILPTEKISKFPAGFELAVALAGAVRGGSWLRLRNLHDPILPFVGVGSRPYQHQRINDIRQGRPLLDEKHTRTLAIRFEEVAEVARHRPEIGSDKNSILTRCEGQHFGIGNSFQRGFMGRKKIDCRLTAKTPGDNRIVETGIRKEADHLSASPRNGLLPQTFKRHPDFGRCWMGSGVSIFFALSFHNVLFHILLTSKIEGDRPINLLETQCRIMRPKGLRGLPALKFPHDVG